MRRILLLFTAAAMMAVLLGMSAGPASAQDLSFWNNWSSSGSPWWWNHDRHDRFDHDGFDHNRFDNDFVLGPNFADQESESGSIETELDVSIEGNNNNQCVGALQFGQTGNFSNQQGTSNFFGDDNDRFRRDDNGRFWHWHDGGNWWHWHDGNDHNDHNDHFGFFDDGDNEFSGPEVTFAPENETACDQAVQQSAAASSTWW